jgi:hypothetical protein
MAAAIVLPKKKRIPIAPPNSGPKLRLKISNDNKLQKITDKQKETFICFLFYHVLIFMNSAISLVSVRKMNTSLKAVKSELKAIARIAFENHLWSGRMS